MLVVQFYKNVKSTFSKQFDNVYTNYYS